MNTTSLVLSLVLALATAVPTAGQKPEPLFRTSGAFIGLSVPDLQASIKWYSDKLGLQITMQEPKRDKASFAVLEGGGLIVELVQLDDAKSLKQVAPSVTDRPFLHGPFKSGMIVEDYERLLGTFKERGVEIAYGPFPARDRQRANVIIRDNAGNLIQIFGASR